MNDYPDPDDDANGQSPDEFGQQGRQYPLGDNFDATAGLTPDAAAARNGDTQQPGSVFDETAGLTPYTPADTPDNDSAGGGFAARSRQRMEGIRDRMRKLATVNDLMSRGMTLDTGRPAQDFGVEGFLEFTPSPAESEVALDYLTYRANSVLDLFADFVREEEIITPESTYTRWVLELAYDSPDGTVHFEVSSDEGITANFTSKDGRTTYNRYHVPDADMFHAPADAIVRRDTTNYAHIDSKLPQLGALPTSVVRARRRAARRDAEAGLARTRAEGTNDLPPCFAEMEYVGTLLLAAHPARPRYVDIVTMENRRSHDVDEGSKGQPFRGESCAAGDKFAVTVERVITDKSARMSSAPEVERDARSLRSVLFSNPEVGGKVQQMVTVEVREHMIGDTTVQRYAVKIVAWWNVAGRALHTYLQQAQARHTSPDAIGSELRAEQVSEYYRDLKSGELRVTVDFVLSNENGYIYERRGHAYRGDDAEWSLIDRYLR